MNLWDKINFSVMWHFDICSWLFILQEGCYESIKHYNEGEKGAREEQMGKTWRGFELTVWVDTYISFLSSDSVRTAAPTYPTRGT